MPELNVFIVNPVKRLNLYSIFLGSFLVFMAGLSGMASKSRWRISDFLLIRQTKVFRQEI